MNEDSESLVMGVFDRTVGYKNDQQSKCATPSRKVRQHVSSLPRQHHTGYLRTDCGPLTNWREHHHMDKSIRTDRYRKYIFTNNLPSTYGSCRILLIVAYSRIRLLDSVLLKHP